MWVRSGLGGMSVFGGIADVGRIFGNDLLMTRSGCPKSNFCCALHGLLPEFNGVDSCNDIAV